MTWLVAACLLAASSASAQAHREVQVAVIALATDLGKPGPASRLAGDLATRLEADGLRVTRLGVTAPLPAEEAVAQAIQARVDFVLGVSATTACPSLLIPPKVAEPVQGTGPIEIGELQALVTQITEAARYKTSAAAAEKLKPSARWCRHVPSEIESYVLTASVLPSIVVRASTGAIGTIAGDIPQALRSALSNERPEEGRTTKR